MQQAPRLCCSNLQCLQVSQVSAITHPLSCRRACQCLSVAACRAKYPGPLIDASVLSATPQTHRYERRLARHRLVDAVAGTSAFATRCTNCMQTPTGFAFCQPSRTPFCVVGLVNWFRLMLAAPANVQRVWPHGICSAVCIGDNLRRPNMALAVYGF